MVFMDTQIDIMFSDELFLSAKCYAESHVFDSLEDLIRELLRETLLDSESDTSDGLSTYLASKRSLARHWLSPEEDKAWDHLQKGV